MVHDVDQILIEQPGVDSVDDTAKADRTIPGREMTVVIHGQCCHPIPGLQANCSESLRQSARIACNSCPIGPLNRAIGPACQNLAIAALARGMINQVRNPQRPILHSSQHGSSHLALFV